MNKSNLLAVIVFHQSATGDTRGNLDFAVERQNHASVSIHNKQNFARFNVFSVCFGYFLLLAMIENKTKTNFSNFYFQNY